MDDISIFKCIDINFHNIENPLKIKYRKQHLNENDWNKTICFPQMCKINIMISGSMNIIASRNLVSPQNGDILLFGPNEPHSGIILGKTLVEYFEFLIPIDAFDNIVNGREMMLPCFMQKKSGTENLLRLPVNTMNNLIRFAYNILNYIESGQPEPELMCYSFVIQALCIINNGYRSRYFVNPKAPLPQCLIDALNYINANFLNLYSLQDITAHLDISASYLNRIFRYYIDYTPYQYLLERKMSNAKLLLQNGAPVTEACFNSGFTDCSKFIKRFKEQNGLTPLNYKTNHSEKLKK